MIQASSEWRARALAHHAKLIQRRAAGLGVVLDMKDPHVAILVRELALIRVELELLGQAINGLAEWEGRNRDGVEARH